MLLGERFGGLLSVCVVIWGWLSIFGDRFLVRIGLNLKVIEVFFRLLLHHTNEGLLRLLVHGGLWDEVKLIFVEGLKFVL